MCAPHPLTRILVALAILGGVNRPAAVVRADGPPRRERPEESENRKEILSTLRDTQQKWGSDVVLLEGHLLGQVVRSGSILAAEISIPGVEERDGKRYLELRVDTGIVYNDREVGASARLTRVWADLVEPSLRKFRKIAAPADGLLFRLGYMHRAYADEAELRAAPPQGRGAPEGAAFYVLLGDIEALNDKRLSARQFLDRAVVLVDGAVARVALDEAAEAK